MATLQTPSASTANSTVSTALEAAWDATDLYVAAYYSHTADARKRWIGISFSAAIGKYVLTTTSFGASQTITIANHDTLGDACDAAAAFLDTETD